MAKLIVEIDMEMSRAELEKSLMEYAADWFPQGVESELISVDNAYLKRDPAEDSFYLFKLVRIEGD